MSFLRALRAYVGLGPDEEIEDRYLYELNARRRVLDLDELDELDELNHDSFERRYADADLDELDLRRRRTGHRVEDIDLRDLDDDDGVQVRPRSGSSARSRNGTGRPSHSRPSHSRPARHGAGQGRIPEDRSQAPGSTDTEAVRRLDAGSRRRRPPVDEALDRVTEEFLANRSPFASDEGPASSQPTVDGFDLDELAADDLVADDPAFDERDRQLDIGDGDVGDRDDLPSEDTLAPSRLGSGTGNKSGRAVERDGVNTNVATRGATSRPEAKKSEAKKTSSEGAGNPETEGKKGVVRSLDSMRAKPRTLLPESFADAKLVADEFKRDVPVLLNLQGLERELARRLIDFASGICYALDGSMEKIASQVFLLIPDGAEVSDEDRRRIEERGYAR